MEIKIGKSVVAGNGKLLLLGGPCVAESEKLCLEIAEYLIGLCAELDIQYVFKASYDKANRSSISSKRGLGITEGLKILKSVKDHFDIPVVTDVHESTEAARAAEVVDLLQIPAFLCRQTDLLVACGKTGLPVNIKKGQFMAPEDMAGVVDKVKSTGNDKIMLCERGSSFGYHNLVVFDATHSVQLPGGLGNASGGRKEFVLPLARAAAAVGIDALFTEVHPRPAEAWSDGPNSLDFAQIKETLTQVKAIHDLCC